ncbi:MAG: hypothetical protein ACI4VX_02155 [Succinivibrionaceae bacterium]
MHKKILPAGSTQSIANTADYRIQTTQGINFGTHFEYILYDENDTIIDILEKEEADLKKIFLNKNAESFTPATAPSGEQIPDMKIRTFPETGKSDASTGFISKTPNQPIINNLLQKNDPEDGFVKNISGYPCNR